MRIVWDEPKRLANIDKHGLDFADLNEDFFADARFVLSKSGRWKGIGGSPRGVICVVFARLGQRRHQRNQHAAGQCAGKEILCRSPQGIRSLILRRICVRWLLTQSGQRRTSPRRKASMKHSLISRGPYADAASKRHPSRRLSRFGSMTMSSRLIRRLAKGGSRASTAIFAG